MLGLLRHLPSESWTQKALQDERFADLASGAVAPEPEPEEPRFGPWSLLNHQIAKLTDAVNQLTYLTAVVGDVDPKPKPPEPTPRPGVLGNRPQRLSGDAVIYLKNLRAKGVTTTDAVHSGPG